MHMLGNSAADALFVEKTSEEQKEARNGKRHATDEK